VTNNTWILFFFKLIYQNMNHLLQTSTSVATTNPTFPGPGPSKLMTPPPGLKIKVDLLCTLNHYLYINRHKIKVDLSCTLNHYLYINRHKIKVDLSCTLNHYLYINRHKIKVDLSCTLNHYLYINRHN
jgi:hypothetical protein